MESLILFLKGFIIGLGKIIPGVSGSVLAVLLGVYEKTLNNIANLKNSWKNSLKFLGPLGCGIILAIILFSRVLLYFISNYSLATMSFFFGILLATIPKIFKEKVCPMPKDWLLILALLFLLIILSTKISLKSFTIVNSLSYFWVFFLGMIDALSMIIPGLSGTAIYILLGSYSFVLNLFAEPFINIKATLIFGCGFLFSFLILLKLLLYCFKKYEHKTWQIIFSFIIYSMVEFFWQIPFSFTFLGLLNTTFWMLLGFFCFKIMPDS